MLDAIEQELKAGGRHILEILLKNKLISAQQFSEIMSAMEKQKKSAIAILLEKNLVTYEGLAQAYSELFQIPYIDLRKLKISPEALFTFPEETIEKHGVTVFEVNKLVYRAALDDPFDSEAWKNLELLDKKDEKDIDLYITSRDGIDSVLKLYKTANKRPEAEAEKIFTPNVPFPQSPPVQISENIGISKPTPPPVAVPQVSNTIVVPITSKEEKQNYVQELGTKAPINKQDIPQIGPEMPNEYGTPPPMADIDISQLSEEKITTPEELKSIIANSSIPKMVGAVIRVAISMRASDIHIEPQENQFRIRFRIDGILSDILFLPKDLLPAIVARIKILSKLKIDEARIPQDSSFRINFEGRLVDLRVSTFPTILGGEKVVVRILDKGSTVLSLEGVGLRGENLARVIKAVEKPFGVVLVTGPTGSGKSTTLYAMINKLNIPKINIVTIEDPVEYTIDGITQSQVNPKIGLTFAEGFRTILRQDPNIIMLGEIRDAETAELAVQAALTGHLILTTLHTSDAPSALPRLIEMGIEPFLLTSAINAILAQRLIRRICPDCKQETKLPPEIINEIGNEISSISNQSVAKQVIGETTKFYKGVGCATCGNTGYKGRLGIFEILSINDEIEDLAVKRETANKIREAAIKAGMITLKQDGAMKVIDGLTTWDEILRVTSEENR